MPQRFHPLPVSFMSKNCRHNTLTSHFVNKKVRAEIITGAVPDRVAKNQHGRARHLCLLFCLARQGYGNEPRRRRTRDSFGFPISTFESFPELDMPCAIRYVSVMLSKELVAASTVPSRCSPKAKTMVTPSSSASGIFLPAKSNGPRACFTPSCIEWKRSNSSNPNGAKPRPAESENIVASAKKAATHFEKNANSG